MASIFTLRFLNSPPVTRGNQQELEQRHHLRFSKQNRTLPSREPTPRLLARGIDDGHHLDDTLAAAARFRFLAFERVSQDRTAARLGQQR